MCRGRLSSSVGRETAAISVPSATIISNYSSFTCFDLDSKLAPMTMYSIVDTIIARQSASGRMAIVGYPDYVPAAHDALARAAREGVAVLQFDNDDRIIYIVLQFATDERRIARQVGVELCRRLGTTGGRWGAIALRRPLHTVPRPRRPHNRRHRRLRDQLPLQAGGEDRGNTALKLFTFHGPETYMENALSRTPSLSTTQSPA